MIIVYNIWCLITNMAVDELAYHEKRYFAHGSFQEIIIWRAPCSEDKLQGLKYSSAYIVAEERVIGYDNSEGKGDHRHY
ncbi:MAG: DUF6516 family protein, partial [Dissulfurispiraceae bacterium]